MVQYLIWTLRDATMLRGNFKALFTFVKSREINVEK